MTRSLTLAVVLAGFAGAAWAGDPACLAVERGDGDTPIIQARLNGQGPYAFILDTAASGTSVVEDVAGRLGLPRDAETEKAQGMGGEVDIHVYRVADLRAGPLSLTDHLGAGLPDFGFESHAVAGLAGVDLFGDALTVWSPASGCVSIRPGGSEPEGESWTPVQAVWTRPWKIMLPIRVAGVEGWGLLDTGAQHTVLSPVYGARLGLVPGSDRVRDGGEIFGIDGRPLPLLEAEADAVSIGPWAWPSRTLKIGAMPVFDRLGEADEPLAIIGIDWLADREFAVDYATQRVWLRAAREPS
jgi:hypothetical protein